MDNRAEVRQFLSSRRGRITPEQAGIEPYGGRRRVPGLRREEVARLAGVSVDYYTRLERGNLSGVSDSVLDAIAGALELDRAEHDHLYDLARAANTSGRKRAASAGAAVPAKVRPELQYLLDAITDAPAFIGNNRLDIVAANTLGYALYSDMYRNPVAAGQPFPVHLPGPPRPQFLHGLGPGGQHQRGHPPPRGRSQPA